MVTKLVWYEVIDLTSYGIKYPKDWCQRCGRKLRAWENSVCESLGQYSTEDKAIVRMKKWADEKGLAFEPKLIPDGFGIYYENDLGITVQPRFEVGLWYDIYDNPTTDVFERSYGTGATVVKKTIELDKD